MTLIYLFLGIRGILRSKKWSDKRKQHPNWRFILRLLPQLVPTLLIGWLFFIVPTLQNNSSTTIDAFGLYPAGMLLLAIVFIIGLVLTILRVYYRMLMSSKSSRWRTNQLGFLQHFIILLQLASLHIQSISGITKRHIRYALLPHHYLFLISSNRAIIFSFCAIMVSFCFLSFTKSKRYTNKMTIIKIITSLIPFFNLFFTQTAPILP